MRTYTTLMLAALFLPALPVAAQDKPDSGVYKVEYTIHDGADASAKTGRRYTMLVDGNSKGNFRVGVKVPYATGSVQPAHGGSPLVSTQYNYVDVGVNIDTRIRESGSKIYLTADMELSTLVQHDKGAAANPPTPTIASTRIGINAMMTPGKPALVASVDDPVTMRKFDIEATVSKVN